MSGLRIAEIRLNEEFEKMRGAWEELVRASGSNSVFLTWQWVSAWWSNYGVPGQLRILAAFDGGGVLRGIAPLRCRRIRRYGQSVRALSFIGDGSNDSEYLDFIIMPGFEAEVIRTFCSYLRGELQRGMVLQLNEIPESSPNLDWLRKEAKARGLYCGETNWPCGTAQLPESWEEYLAGLRPRFRTKVRSVLRNLENRPEIRFGFCETQAEVRRVLPCLFDLHTRRWAQEGKPGVFGWQAKRGFYLDLSMQLLDRGWLRFSWVEWNKTILACQYGFAYRGTYFHLQEGYEPSAEHWNLGIGLRAWSIRGFFKEGLREYDFLGGVKRHKIDWGACAKQSMSLVIAKLGANNFVYCSGPRWETNAREWTKRIVPDKILATVRPYFEPPQLGGIEREISGHGQTARLREAAAACYVYSGMPTLTRQIRDRYRISFSSGVRAIRLSRKTKPAARILYYHRVNDDNDPFFPAISTRLFEQEMRFLARHYKVVGLADLINHLSDGHAQDVVAVTFDDGYRDNFENAFPILERYGLPATIFLTTGSIDSGEPLWFDQLANALKTTRQDFIDLEVDIPRRFWLRTPAERLQANDRIFTLLRGLEDLERRRVLGGIFSELRSGGRYGRTDQMLTWDQIRTMKAKGFGFGGHTVTHPFLSKMACEDMVWEVSECKRRVEDELQTSVDFFAYPNGREQDFTDRSKEVLRQAGYQAAVTTLWGLNYASTDPFELRRGQPWEESATMFAYKLDWYQLVSA